MAKETLLTPFRKCMYPFLQKPQISDGYKDTFKIAILFNGRDKEDAAILKQISQLHIDAGGPQKSGDKGHPIKFHATKEIEEDGTEKWIQVPDVYSVTFKKYADHADHIPTYDTNLNDLWRENNFVANGSTVRISWNHSSYNTGGNKGVFLSLEGVQIKDLIEWQGRDADSLGFENTEGYVKDDDVEKAFDDNGGTAQEPGDDLGEQDGSPVEDDDLPF